MQNAEAAKTNWLTLLRSGGEMNLGAELVRLATLAAAVHQYEAARPAAGDAGGRMNIADDVRADGPARGAVVAAPECRVSGRPLHTEVRR